MKLKTATRIQKITDIALRIVMLPFGLFGIVFGIVTEKVVMKPLAWIVDMLETVRFRIGNKLLRMSDEAKDGTIQNEYCLRNFTSMTVYKKLKKNGKDFCTKL